MNEGYLPDMDDAMQQFLASHNYIDSRKLINTMVSQLRSVLPKEQHVFLNRIF